VKEYDRDSKLIGGRMKLVTGSVMFRDLLGRKEDADKTGDM